MKKILIISTAPLIKEENKKYFSAYSPYVTELEIWNKNLSSLSFCCPIWRTDKGLLKKKIDFPIFNVYPVIEFSLDNNILKLIQLPFIILYNFFLLFLLFFRYDLIHIRCPGNISLIATFVQIFFPFKKKIVKYAGNWDSTKKEPFSNKIQKYIYNNTFLSKNVKVLVYGKWKNQTKNIISFYTATYWDFEVENFIERDFSNKIRFLFVGSLTYGKNAIYAINILEKLIEKGYNVSLDILGNGFLKNELEEYCNNKKITNSITLQGNKNFEDVKSFYKQSHFLILPSKSEGWPKAVAEAMFWGCVPIASNVSCISTMLEEGQRGVILEMNLKKDVFMIEKLITNFSLYIDKSKKAYEWSINFTLNKFEDDLKKIIND